MMIKKITASLLCAALTVGMMTGCSGDKAKVDINLSEVAQVLQSQLTFKDKLNQVDDDLLGNFYPSVELEKVEEYVVYVSGTGSTAEEIALFEVKTSENVDMVKNAINERLTDQKISYQDYVPEEMVKIENAVIKTGGNYVFAVLCDDTEAAGKILADYLK